MRWVARNRPKKGDRALDVGFGSGSNLELLERKGYDPYGVDVSSTAIKHGKKISKNFNLSLLKPPKLDFPDRHFSFVISLQALYYNIELEAVLKEIWRVMRKNAYVYISFYGKNHWWIKEGSKKIGPTLIEWSQDHPSQTGLKLRFFDTKAKYLKLFQMFGNIEINKYTDDLFGRYHEYIYITAQKKD